LRTVLKNSDKALVKQWQAFFRSLAIYTGEVDGIYSPATETALAKCRFIEKCSDKLNTGQ